MAMCEPRQPVRKCPGPLPGEFLSLCGKCQTMTRGCDDDEVHIQAWDCDFEEQCCAPASTGSEAPCSGYLDGEFLPLRGVCRAMTHGCYDDEVLVRNGKVTVRLKNSVALNRRNFRSYCSTAIKSALLPPNLCQNFSPYFKIEAFFASFHKIGLFISIRHYKKSPVSPPVPY